MSIESIPHFTLFRVYRDGTTEPVELPEKTDEVTVIETGYRLCREEREVAFSLYRDGTRRMKFCHDRLALRLKPGSVEMMVS